MKLTHVLSVAVCLLLLCRESQQQVVTPTPAVTRIPTSASSGSGSGNGAPAPTPVPTPASPPTPTPTPEPTASPTEVDAVTSTTAAPTDVDTASADAGAIIIQAGTDADTIPVTTWVGILVAIIIVLMCTVCAIVFYLLCLGRGRTHHKFHSRSLTQSVCDSEVGFASGDTELTMETPFELTETDPKLLPISRPSSSSSGSPPSSDARYLTRDGETRMSRAQTVNFTAPPSYVAVKVKPDKGSAPSSKSRFRRPRRRRRSRSNSRDKRTEAAGAAAALDTPTPLVAPPVLIELVPTPRTAPASSLQKEGGDAAITATLADQYASIMLHNDPTDSGKDPFSSLNMVSGNEHQLASVLAAQKQRRGTDADESASRESSAPATMHTVRYEDTLRSNTPSLSSLSRPLESYGPTTRDADGVQIVQTATTDMNTTNALSSHESLLHGPPTMEAYSVYSAHKAEVARRVTPPSSEETPVAPSAADADAAAAAKKAAASSRTFGRPTPPRQPMPPSQHGTITRGENAFDVEKPASVVGLPRARSLSGHSAADATPSMDDVTALKMCDASVRPVSSAVVVSNAAAGFSVAHAIEAGSLGAKSPTLVASKSPVGAGSDVLSVEDNVANQIAMLHGDLGAEPAESAVRSNARPAALQVNGGFSHNDNASSHNSSSDSSPRNSTWPVPRADAQQATSPVDRPASQPPHAAAESTVLNALVLQSGTTGHSDNSSDRSVRNLMIAGHAGDLSAPQQVNGGGISRAGAVRTEGVFPAHPVRGAYDDDDASDEQKSLIDPKKGNHHGLRQIFIASEAEFHSNASTVLSSVATSVAPSVYSSAASTRRNTRKSTQKRRPAAAKAPLLHEFTMVSPVVVAGADADADSRSSTPCFNSSPQYVEDSSSDNDGSNQSGDSDFAKTVVQRN